MAGTAAAPLSVPQLSGLVEELERELRRAQLRIERAEERAALAEKASRDAWAFAKALRGCRRLDS